MNVLIILDYFKYFISFAHQPSKIKYFYITARRKFLTENIPNFSYCDLKYYKINNGIPKGDWRSYFKASLALGSINPKVNLEKLSAYLENYFENYLRENEIEVLISGGTTGFERCGLAAAKRMGIKTHCVWEGFFRPNTISIDPEGMNAESSFYRKSFQEISKHTPSSQFTIFYDKYLDLLKNVGYQNKNLRIIQGERFNLIHQARNRWIDRKDFERIRLSFILHTTARLSYYSSRSKYFQLQEISGPFIFFPLQTHTDSNVIINGELYPFEKYIDLVFEAFLKVKNIINCKLVIKEHPFDVFRKKYNREVSKDILWLAPETSVSRVLLNHYCLGTIVVNSTSGFESLVLNKPVISLARSIYARKELVLIPEENNTEVIARLLEMLPDQKVNSELINKFTAYLFDNIQFEGNLDVFPSFYEIQNFGTKYLILS